MSNDGPCQVMVNATVPLSASTTEADLNASVPVTDTDLNVCVPVKNGRVLVFGGTSDSMALCGELEKAEVNYSFSVATEAGRQMARGIKGQLLVGRMDVEQMRHWMQDNRISLVIDAAHPYAQELRQNVMTACHAINLPLVRFERKSESFTHPLLIDATSVDDACQKIKQNGWHKVMLTTGSKDLATFCEQLPEQHIIARVLPTAEVLAQCEALGLGIDHIVAMKGPFSRELNLALYVSLLPDVMVTKESGQAGGFLDKVQPCVEQGIPCIVISRPKPVLVGEYCKIIQDMTACSEWLQRGINN